MCSNKARLLRKAERGGKKKRSATAALCACALAAAAAVPGGERVRSGPPDPKLRGAAGASVGSVAGASEA